MVWLKSSAHSLVLHKEMLYLLFFQYILLPTTREAIKTPWYSSSIDDPFHINNVPISDVRPKNELFRILGCFWTLDGYHTQIVQVAIKELKNLLRSSRRTYIPGPIRIKLLLNPVAIPIIQYRLLLSSITSSQYEAIEVLLRDAARYFSKQKTVSNNAMLYDKSMGFQLFSF